MITEEGLAQVATYDFAVSGGAISSITLPGVFIPPGAIITDSLIIVDTIPVGAGASIGITLESAADIAAVAAISGAPWSTLGAKHGTQTATTAPITTTVQRQLVAVISGAVLTAGKFRIGLRYVLAI